MEEVFRIPLAPRNGVAIVFGNPPTDDLQFSAFRRWHNEQVKQMFIGRPRSTPPLAAQPDHEART